MPSLEVAVAPSRPYRPEGTVTSCSASSSSVKSRVDAARERQHKRFSGDGNMCNARMGPDEMRAHCQLSEVCASLMKQAFEALGLTARSYDRILKVARTIADLDGSDNIQPQHIAEAIQYRTVNLGNR